MSLRRHEIEELAHLARLAGSVGLPDAAQLEQVLGWLTSLQEVDVDGVPEMEMLGPAAVRLREDVPGPLLDRDAALAAVPAVDDGQVVVPRFVEE